MSESRHDSQQAKLAALVVALIVLGVLTWLWAAAGLDSAGTSVFVPGALYPGS